MHSGCREGQQGLSQALGPGCFPTEANLVLNRTHAQKRGGRSPTRFANITDSVSAELPPLAPGPAGSRGRGGAPAL